VTNDNSASFRAGSLAARPSSVAFVYTCLAVIMTWPLVTHLGTEIASDLGDPVFNCWILLWTSGQLLAALRGDFSAIHQYWNGNIFAPEPLTIAYSEHLTPQMLQGLPLLAATGNVVLTYNLLFLSTFVLSGLGVYLLVRDLTGRPLAAFIAGLAFAFAPYRISQHSHLQVLSSQWMPFALYGFRRYFESRRRKPLIGASSAVVVQNLSCGYYMLFFAPFVVAYCLYEMATRGLMRRIAVWRSLILAAAGVALLTWPFVTPYFALRHKGDVGVRSYGEAVQFSADVYSFATAAGGSRLWGGVVNAFPKGEGEGFPGFTIVLLATVGLVAAAMRSRQAARVASDRKWQRVAFVVLTAAAAVSSVALGWMLLAGQLPIRVEGRPWHDSNPLLAAVAVFAIALVALVPGVRRALSAAAPVSFYALAALAAAILSLGPRLQSAGHLLGAGPYLWLHRWVPGFDGVRAPARYFMLVALFLSVLAGLGMAAILRRLSPDPGPGTPDRTRDPGPRTEPRTPDPEPRTTMIAVSAVVVLALLAESWVAPMSTNVRLDPHYYELTPRRLDMGDAMSPVYRAVRDMPGKVVLIEFPFGEPAYEILATFYAGYHRRPLVNGYSGFFPEPYLRRATFLQHIPFDLDAATRAVLSSGATHALVHEGAYPDGRGHEVTSWLTSSGGRVITTFGTDKLLTLR
jgi:hypothetical protein